MGRRYAKSKDEATDDLKQRQRSAMYDAVRQFNKMVPALNGFARALTGDPKIRVKAGAVTETDSRTIFIRPPLSLAMRLDHERMECGKRNNEKRLICPACARDEDVWRKLHHEMAHIIGKSMMPTSSHGLDIICELVDEYHPADVCNHGMPIIREIRAQKNYLGATMAFNSYLHYILQSVEDARIDSHMLQVKPGLRTQFYASTAEVFTYGVEGELGEAPFMWREAPLHSQIIIGLSLVGSGYYIEEGWLVDEARAVLDDPELRAILQGAGMWRDVVEATRRSVAAFRRLAALGLFEIPKCQKEEAEEEPPPSLNKPGNEGEASDEPGEPEQDDEAGEADAEGDGGEAGDGSDAGEEPDDDAPADSGDDAEASDGGTGSGNDGGDPTGDGTAGDTVSDGAFGDDFESDDRARGSDKEGGDSDDQSKCSQVPGEQRGDDEPSGESGSSDGDDEDDVNEDPSGSDGAVPADSSTGGDDQAEASDDEAEAPVQGDREPSASDEPADPDGDLDAEEPGRDGHGEPATQGQGDIGSGSGGTGDGDGPEIEPESAGPDADSSEDSGDSEDGSALGADALDDEDDGDSPVGHDIWEEENPALRAIRSMTPEEMGLPEEVAEALSRGNPHDHVDDHVESDPFVEDPDLTDEEIMVILNQALTDAVGQAGYFDRASQEVGGVTEYEFPTEVFRWVRSWSSSAGEFIPPEKVTGPALMKARAVFASNARTKKEADLRSGRVDSRKLGRRVAVGDDRIFYRKQLPGKRDYVVGITVDCSGSTQVFGRMERIKRAVFAKAEILARLGIKFYITGHTGGREDYWTTPGGYIQAQAKDPDTLENLMILWVKKPDEPWDDKARERLATLAPLANNFDGHTLEFHRKILEQRRETDKVLIYYTDGAMPAANYDEELEILRREIPLCERVGISLLAVGINSDSPREYGFDTVRVDSDEDVIKVVDQLERRLTAGR